MRLPHFRTGAGKNSSWTRICSGIGRRSATSPTCACFHGRSRLQTVHPTRATAILASGGGWHNRGIRIEWPAEMAVAPFTRPRFVFLTRRSCSSFFAALFHLAFLSSPGDGEIDFDEFQSMMKKHAVKEVDELKQAFDVFDKDGDGSISAKELEIVMKGQWMAWRCGECALHVQPSKMARCVSCSIGFSSWTHRCRSSVSALGEPIDRQTIDLMIESVDIDKSGFIDFNEFRQMMREGPQEKE